MGEKRSRSGLFACFVVADPECEAAAGEGRNRLQRRSLRKIFSHLRKKASKSSSWRGSISSEQKSEEEEEHQTGPVSSSTSSLNSSSLFTSSSSSSCSSSRSSTAGSSSLSEPEEPAKRRKQSPFRLKPPHISDAATGAFVLVATLSATVFLGRLCAILCTSCLLFAVACQSSNGEAAGPWEAEGRRQPAAVLRRKAAAGKANRNGFLARNQL